MTSNDEAEIQKIALYYAYAVDALGNHQSVPKAIEFLRRGFIEDCAFQYRWPDGSSFGDVTGVVAFAEFAIGFMRQKQYCNTQHMVANFLVHVVSADVARMDSCVVARHFLRDKSQDVAVARYEDEILRVDGSWKCRVRKCIQMSFDNFAPAYSLN